MNDDLKSHKSIKQSGLKILCAEIRSSVSIMASLLLPDQTYGDEFRKKKLKKFDKIDKTGSYHNSTIESRRTSNQKELSQNKSKVNNLEKMKRYNQRERHLRYRLNTGEESDSENSLKISDLQNNAIADELSLYSFTSESSDDEIIGSLKYFQADPHLTNDVYNQEMARLLKGIKVWETTNSGDNTIIRKQTSHHRTLAGGGSESSNNKKSFNEHKRTTSWDNYRAKQKSKHFLAKNNIRPEFFCQYKHLIG